jgi:hypothetical protein
MRWSGSARPVVILMLCGAFVIALVICTIALILSNLRDHAIEASKQQLLSTATVLAKQAARDFEAVDLIEASLIEHMQTLAVVSNAVYVRSIASRDIELMLQDKISGFPHIEAVMLVGADGTVINTSATWPTPPLNLADRDYFCCSEREAPSQYLRGAPRRHVPRGSRNSTRPCALSARR